MNFLFLTNEIDLNAKAGGSQRSNILLNAFKEALPPNSNLIVEQIAFSDFELVNLEQVNTTSSFAQDIEFAIRLDVLLERHASVLSELIHKIEDSDFIIFDNCYLGPLLKYIRSELRVQPLVMYLSHNYEKSLKSEVSRILKWPENETKKNLEFVGDIENFLWRESDFVVVCSTADGESLNETFKRSYIHLPNGGFKRRPPKMTWEVMHKYLDCNSFCLFVASGHPPNSDGFMKGVGLDFGFIPTGSKMIIVGTSAYAIEQSIVDSKYYETYLKKSCTFPTASDELLDNLYAYAGCVILPIFSGSGTSIKSIEALISGRQIIATTFAFRGLDGIEEHLPQIDFCSDKTDFKLSILNRLQTSNNNFVSPEKNFDLEWAIIKQKATQILESIFDQITENKK